MTDDHERLYLEAQTLENGELEARVKGPILHKAAVSRLLDEYHDWQMTEYTEQRSRIVGVSAVYRCIDDGPIVMKTKVDRIRDEWYTLVLSTEEPVDGMTLVSRYFATTEKTRWSRDMASNVRLDVTYIKDQDMYQVELEMTKIKHRRRFQKHLQHVIGLLLDSTLYISRKRFELVQEIANGYGTHISVHVGKYQKPVTLSWDMVRDLVTNVKDLRVTPKMDGARMFLVSFNGMVYSVDIQCHVRLLAMDTTYTSPMYHIIDTELVQGVYHAFDVVSGDGVVLDTRAELLQQAISHIKDHVHVVVKEYTPLPEGLLRVDAIKEAWSDIRSKQVDGMIFVDGSSPYLDPVYKWKPVVTIDANIMGGVLYAAHGKRIRELVLKVPMDVSETTVYELEIYNKNHAKVVRERKDKPSANSKRVVKANIAAANLGSIWDKTGCHLMRIYHSNIRKDLMESRSSEKLLEITQRNIHTYARDVDATKVRVILIRSIPKVIAHRPRIVGVYMGMVPDKDVVTDGFSVIFE
ncbi:hypothetical protein BGZ89_005714 [Linnemannia elongata]|nr:hypothetical protein BGZ89_005714 [Linnemannia elongata]